MNKRNGVKKRAKQHLLKARRLLMQASGRSHSEKEIIARIRQTRERLWSSKFASRS